MIEMMGVAFILTEFLAYKEDPLCLGSLRSGRLAEHIPVISSCVYAWVILLLHFEK